MSNNISILTKLLLVLLALYILFCIIDRYDTIEMPLKICRLAKLPHSAKIISARKTGSIFTRGYKLKFLALTNVVDKWVIISPGIKNAYYCPPSKYDTVLQDGLNGYIPVFAHSSSKYILQPTKGVCWSEINIEKKDSFSYVEIYTYSD